MKVIVIVVLVLAVIVGLLLTLRTSRNAGMPSADVIKRAQQRSRAEADDDKGD